MERNSLLHVFALHAVYTIYLVTLENMFHCSGPAFLVYLVFLLFSYTTIKRASASPDQVLHYFLGNYPRLIYGFFLVYIVLLGFNILQQSAILDLITVGFGLINAGILYFVCPIVAGPMLLKLLTQTHK